MAYTLFLDGARPSIHSNTSSGVSRGETIARNIKAWLGVDVSARSFINEQRTGLRLLALVVITDLIFFAALSIKMIAAPIEPAASLFLQQTGFWLFVAFVVRSAFLYSLAGLLARCGRLAGGSASMQETLKGVIWGATVAAPLAVVAALLAMLIGALQPILPALDVKWVTVLPYWLSLIAFVWLVALGAAKAHGLKYITPVLAPTMTMTILGIVGTIGVMGLIAVM